MSGLRALSWYGGKSMHATQGVGRWVLSLLPPVTPGQTYVEAYAGMLSVLLARPPAFNEVANDLDGRVYNFWRVLRDTPDELERLLADTPHCEQTYYQALAQVRSQTAIDAPDVSAAWAFCVSVGQGVMSLVAEGGWRTQRGYRRATTLRPERIARGWRNRSANLTSAAFADRIREVSLQCRDGADVARYYADNPHAVIYCDPPYSDGAYGYDQKADQSALIAAVCDAQARVAISGYGSDPYDELGWHRYEHDLTLRLATPSHTKTTDRTEVLWTNYDAHATNDTQQVLL